LSWFTALEQIAWNSKQEVGEIELSAGHIATGTLLCHYGAIMANGSAHPRKNHLGEPSTVYLTHAQKEKLKRLAEKRSQEVKAPVSLSNMLRFIIDELAE
jgi:hypothetical protein